MAGRHSRSRRRPRFGSRSAARNLSFATRRQRRFPLRLVAVVALVIVIAAAAVLIRAATTSVPSLRVTRTLPPSVHFPGSAPVPAWPSGGEAAVEVQGLGSLGSSGPQKPLPIASVAKVMTAYVILRDHPIKPGQTGFSVTVSAADVADYKQSLTAGDLVTPVAAGEVLNEAQLLQALLVASGNNIAPILANYDAGSVTAFVAKMNDTAHRLGMSHTNYADASGVSPATVSTAGDQLELAAAAMADPVFATTVAMTSVTLPVAGTMTNFNKAVGTGGYVGIKTGSDSQAGGCLVFANRQTVGGRSFTILGVVLGQDPGQPSTAVLTAASLNAADAIVTSVKSSVKSVTLLPAGTKVASVTSRDGRHTEAVTSAAIDGVGWGGMVLPVQVNVSRIGTSVAAGAPVAEVTIPGGTPAQTEATTTSAVPPVSFGWKVRNLL